MSLQSSITSKLGERHDMVFDVNGISFKMVNIEGGSFWMGAQSDYSKDRNYDEDAWPAESPVHKVTLDSFLMGETVVTQALWEAVTGQEMSCAGAWKNGTERGDENPACGFYWYNMNQFLKQLNNLTGKSFRIPTEAEWEYAARGGTKSRGYLFAGSNDLDEVGWYEDNSDGKHHDVKCKKPNELGLYDMSGNIFEWCSDWYGPYSAEPQINPKGAPERWLWVLRGGCWCAEARACRVTDRARFVEGMDYSLLGFRLVLANA